MGENAEDMVEGRTCSYCGQFFQDAHKPNQIYEHGHPVVCKECWRDLSPAERRDAPPQATADTT